MFCQKVTKITLPTEATLAIATSAISAASIPYSMRSWPSSRPARRRMAASVHTMCPRLFEMRGRRSVPPSLRLLPCTPCSGVSLRRRRKRGRDVREDRVDVVARAGDRDDADQRDQRDEQRVLEQVLPFFVSRES